jgi:ribosomal protein S18 acetylase RimI-like enzyme
VQFALRNYRPDDFRTLLAIDQACFQPGIAYTPFELKTYILRQASFTLVAERSEHKTEEAKGVLKGVLEDKGSNSDHHQNASIVGFIVAELTRGSGHIVTIDVRAEARRHQVGSMLLHAAEERLRLWNCRVVRLETAVDNISALCFYKRHGFSVVRTIPRYYSNGVDALLLEKDLLSPPPSR